MQELILGLLFIRSMTTYEVRKSIQNGLDLISSDSMGSIHIAIKNLDKNGYIASEEYVDSGKFKRVYSLTDSGKRYFLEWVNAPIESKKNRNPELKKLYFMGLSDNTLRVNRIEAYIETLRSERIQLESIHSISESIYNSLEGSNREIGKYQIATIQYGLDLIQFEIDWYTRLLNHVLHGDRV